MSDEFLYRLREMPRPEFAEALKARVFRERPRSPTARRVRTGLAVLLAALIIAACAAPQTRMPIVQATKAVVRVFLLPQTVPYSVYTTGGPPRMEVILPSGEKKMVTIETMSLGEAQQRVPFQIHIPTWVPEGLEMNPLTVIPPEAYGDWVVLAGWRGPYSGGMLFPDMHPERVPLSLRIEGPNVRRNEEESAARMAEGLVLPVNKENVVVEIVTTPPPEATRYINGKPTILVECPCCRSAHLHWVREDDGVSYTLIANMDMVSLEDLIRVAETIR